MTNDDDIEERGPSLTGLGPDGFKTLSEGDAFDLTTEEGVLHGTVKGWAIDCGRAKVVVEFEDGRRALVEPEEELN